MSTVRIEELKAGSILSSDVKNGQGQLLIRANTKINDHFLLLLKSWGISAVQVDGLPEDHEGINLPPQESESQLAHRLELAKDSIRENFRQNDLQSPVMSELFEACARRKLKISK